MRDSDTGLDWKVAIAASLVICSLPITAGLLADGILRLLGWY